MVQPMTFGKFDLVGRSALITGAAGLLGIEHAAALLETGARVILTDIDEKLLSDAKSRLEVDFISDNIIVEKLDVTSQKQIVDVNEKLLSNGIGIDILVNNAALNPKAQSVNAMGETSRLENFSCSQWDKEISVGLTGAFLCSQVFGNEMAQTGRGGIILNIASDLSLLAPDQRLYKKEGLPEEKQPVKPVTYSVIKAGLVGLTRYLSTYWADKGVRSNALSPGGVQNHQGEEFIRRITNLIPLGRMANINEYRSAIQFLCSDASLYMNGQNIVIDGGRSVL